MKICNKCVGQSSLWQGTLSIAEFSSATNVPDEIIDPLNACNLEKGWVSGASNKCSS